MRSRYSRKSLYGGFYPDMVTYCIFITFSCVGQACELARLPTTSPWRSSWWTCRVTGTAGAHEAPRRHSRRSSEPRSFTTGGQQLVWHVYRLERGGDVETDASFYENCHFKGREPSGRMLHVLSLIPRPLPAFLCCTLKSETAWYLKSRARFYP